MKKILESFFILFLFTLVSNIFISGCGSEIDTSGNRKIKVTIPFELSEKSFQKPNQINYSNLIYGPAPSNIRSVRVDCVYSDGLKISNMTDVSPGTYVEINMEVNEGSNIYFKAFAYDGPNGTGNLLYTGLSSPQKLEMNKAYEILIQMVPNDATPPTIISVTPANGATDVPKDSVVTIIFSEAIDPTTLTVTVGGSETIQFTPSGWTPTVNYSGTTATLSSPMQFFTNTTYTFTITTGVKDLAGNAMSSSYTWSFTTTAGTAPSVTSVSPYSGATGVATNTSISATFSEGIDTSTINTSTFTVSGATGNIAGSISTSTTTPTVAKFKPSVNLSPNTTYTATITTGVKNWAGVSTISNYIWSFTTGTGADTTPPTIISVTPANGSTNVPTDSVVTIIFSEAMDPTTLTVSAGGSETIKFTPSGWTPTINYSGTTATLSSPMQFFTGYTYTFTITTGVKDAAGNAMSSSYTWSFTTTGGGSDTTPPTIISVTPPHGATGVPKDSIVTIIFSEAMDPTTLTVSAGGSETIKFTPSGWTPTINYSGTTATLTSPMQFFTNTTYTFTITAGVKDLAGNAMASSYTWSFTTTAGTAPSVTSVSPYSGATGVATNTSISVTFSEGIDTSTINTSTFTVSGATGNIAGSISTSTTTPTVATFTPSVSLSPSTTYTATITTGVKNWVGVAITSNYTWSFTTSGGSDTTPPTVSSVSPANGSTNVPTSSVITIIFSEAMDPTTLTVSAGGSETIKFTPSGWTPTINYSGTTATLSSPMQFSLNTTYTFTITTGVKDASGNAMASSYTWSFTTTAGTAPSVNSVSPSNGATGVSTNSTISATFSEGMNISTINTTTFTVSGGAGNIAGSISTSATTPTVATFTPSVSLSPSTTYTATITTGVKNWVGVAITSNYTWSFTTGSGADTTPPTVSSVSPANGATNVPTSSIVTIIFSEAMNPTTLTVTSGGSETIQFSPSGWTPTVNYSGTTATLSSPMQFFAGYTYTFTITTGVKDAAGNAMASSYSWSFTTQ